MSNQGLKKIEGEARVNSLLIKVRDHDLQCFVWRFIGDKKILAQVKIVSIRKFRKDFKIVPISPLETQAFNLIIGSTEEVNLYVASEQIVFRSHLIQIENNSVLVKYPQFYAQTERRKSLRLPTYADESAKSKFSKCVLFPRFQMQYFQKTCFDISAGGASIVVSKLEGKFFQVDDEIPQIEINLGGRIMTMDAKVVATHELLPGSSDDVLYRVQRISLKFTKIAKKDFEFISQYIFERIDLEKDAG